MQIASINCTKYIYMYMYMYMHINLYMSMYIHVHVCDLQMCVPLVVHVASHVHVQCITHIGW